MGFEQVPSTLTLTITEAELYETQEGTGKFLSKGSLNVYFIYSEGSFMISLNEFSYKLSKKTPVLSKPLEGLPQYVLPSSEGFYVIRVKKFSNFSSINDLENLFEDHCTLAHEVTTIETAETIKEAPLKEVPLTRAQTIEYDEPTKDATAALMINNVRKSYTRARSNPLEMFIDLFGKKKNTNKVQETVIEKKLERKSTTEITSETISKGGEYTRSGLIKGAESVSGGLNYVADYVKVNYIKERKEVDISHSTMTKVKTVQEASEKVGTFTTTKVGGALATGKIIAMNAIQYGANTIQISQKLHDNQSCCAILSVSRSTVHAVGCVFEGMLEAIDIIGKGFCIGASDIIEHKYGEKVGTVVKTGIETYDNLDVMDAMQRELLKAMKKPEQEITIETAAEG